METWVLVIWIAAGYSGGSTSIPGYESNAACVAAGKVLQAELEGFLRGVRAICIPGPKAKKDF